MTHPKMQILKPIHLASICFLLCLGACSFNQTHRTDEHSEIQSLEGQSIVKWDLLQTGQKESYAPGDDGDVRSGRPWPSPRFMDKGDGTVSDQSTGLMWTRNADAIKGKIDWEEALASSAACKDGGHSDWRLPNRNELASLIDLGRSEPALASGHPFKNVRSDYYWTSTTPANNDDHAWVIHFYIGFITHDDKGGSHHVWYVRDGR
jgi:hypothetical protein